jgi:uncharacterized membrane protein
MTGYTVMIARKQVIRLAMSVDQALRYIITGGVILPEQIESPAATAVKSLVR